MLCFNHKTALRNFTFMPPYDAEKRKYKIDILKFNFAKLNLINLLYQTQS